MLYIISTPIGNLEDITYRAVRILKEVDLIAAEDTRQTSKLKQKYNISTKTSSYNDQNKKFKTKKFIHEIKKGQNIALVSDSGTPLISDPGFYLVREAIKNNIKVIPVPGPSSTLAALVGSGLPCHHFTFLGFVPKKGKSNFFKKIKKYEHTVILFESPHRIKKTLKTMQSIMPNADVVLARELTKKFEEFIRGKPQQILHNAEILKGEIVLVINL
ncbi:MAG: Ribosomal RNA small subunit methyltransferase I [Candidatus Woesearchaeota archaeon]|nr:Ribosomal RNA small subunit methyltransferase I [Candidatus Woesearchaeota archaeon]